MFALIGYWLVQALAYLLKNPLDGAGGKPPSNEGQEGEQRQGGGPRPDDIGHAHIRSMVDSSKPAPGSDSDARSLRNASLARSAAFRVNTTLRESEPRIHALVEELGAAAARPGPLPRPRTADVDPVAQLVYAAMLAERERRGPDGALSPRERAALETVLLEEVAARAAEEQVREFVAMFAKGAGAGQPPAKAAH